MCMLEDGVGPGLFLAFKYDFLTWKRSSALKDAVDMDGCVS